MELPWKRCWAAATSRPYGLSARTGAHALAGMFTVIGLLALVAARTSALPGDAQVMHLATAASALVSALVIVLFWRRLPDPVFFALHVSQAVVLAVGVRQAGSAVDAAVWAFLFVLLLIESFFVLSWLEAGADFVVAAALLAWAATSQPGLTAEHQVVALGVLVATCVVTGWLVRATARAEVDQLTGGLNRRGLQRRLEELIAARGGRGSPDPLVFALLDLDHFKNINDTLGHAAGDELLRAVVSSAGAVLPPGAVLARWGGDEFVLVVVGADADADSVCSLLERLRRGLPQGRSVSAGVACWAPGEDAASLVHRADLALYEVKRTRRGRTHVDGRATDSERAEAELERAIGAGEVEVVYQPFVDLVTGEVVGATAAALRRMQSVLPPGRDVGRAHPVQGSPVLDRFVLTRAALEVASWPPRRDGVARLVCIPVSPEGLQRQGLAGDVLAVARSAGIDPGQLVVEVADELVGPAVAGGPAVLADLRAAGVRLAATGLGGAPVDLVALPHRGLHAVVLDARLTAAARGGRAEEPAGTAADREVLAAVVRLGVALGMVVVAGGVEDPEQAARLSATGCRYGSGPLFGAPLSAEGVRRRLTGPDERAATTASSLARQDRETPALRA